MSGGPSSARSFGGSSRSSTAHAAIADGQWHSFGNGHMAGRSTAASASPMRSSASTSVGGPAGRGGSGRSPGAHAAAADGQWHSFGNGRVTGGSTAASAPASASASSMRSSASTSAGASTNRGASGRSPATHTLIADGRWHSFGSAHMTGGSAAITGTRSMASASFSNVAWHGGSWHGAAFHGIHGFVVHPGFVHIHSASCCFFAFGFGLGFSFGFGFGWGWPFWGWPSWGWYGPPYPWYGPWWGNYGPPPPYSFPY